MNYSVKNVKDILADCITELSLNAKLFLKNPAKDFSRNRKLSFTQMLESILCKVFVCLQLTVQTLKLPLIQMMPALFFPEPMDRPLTTSYT